MANEIKDIDVIEQKVRKSCLRKNGYIWSDCHCSKRLGEEMVFLHENSYERTHWNQVLYSRNNAIAKVNASAKVNKFYLIKHSFLTFILLRSENDLVSAYVMSYYYDTESQFSGK